MMDNGFSLRGPSVMPPVRHDSSLSYCLISKISPDLGAIFLTVADLSNHTPSVWGIVGKSGSLGIFGDSTCFEASVHSA
jgi:hypothetical protein